MAESSRRHFEKSSFFVLKNSLCNSQYQFIMSFAGCFNGYLRVFPKYHWILNFQVHRLDTDIIGPVSDMNFFEQDIAMTSPILHGLIMSSILLPSAISSVFAGDLADAVGQPRAVTIGFCIFALGAVIEAGSIHIAMFIGG